GYDLVFGTGADLTARLKQTIEMKRGNYRLSWYTPAAQGAGGATAGFVNAQENVQSSAVEFRAGAKEGDWNRAFIRFTLSEDSEVTVGFQRPTGTTTSIRVGAPMLERVPDLPDEFLLGPF